MRAKKLAAIRKTAFFGYLILLPNALFPMRGGSIAISPRRHPDCLLHESSLPTRVGEKRA
jgi:hypothetical protein